MASSKSLKVYGYKVPIYKFTYYSVNIKYSLNNFTVKKLSKHYTSQVINDNIINNETRLTPLM
jgi:hypothetical protein